MKYIKQYDGYITTNQLLPKDGLQIGDYVLLKHSDLNPIRDEINVYKIITAFEYSREEKNSPTRYNFKIRRYGQTSAKSDMWRYPQYLEFLTKNEDEIEHLISSRKYNL